MPANHIDLEKRLWEAARKAGLAIESVARVQETEPFIGLTAVKEEKLPITKSEALMNQ